MPKISEENDGDLNNCEAHLLKLVIPFMRIGYLPRSLDFKLSGSLICVEAKVGDTIQKILPINQQLIPVALKRKLEYSGYYINQVISKEKVLGFFSYLKRDNHLFKDLEFDEQRLIDFIHEAATDSDSQYLSRT